MRQEIATTTKQFGALAGPKIDTRHFNYLVDGFEQLLRLRYSPNFKTNGQRMFEELAKKSNPTTADVFRMLATSLFDLSQRMGTVAFSILGIGELCKAFPVASELLLNKPDGIHTYSAVKAAMGKFALIAVDKDGKPFLFSKELLQWAQAGFPKDVAEAKKDIKNSFPMRLRHVLSDKRTSEDAFGQAFATFTILKMCGFGTKPHTLEKIANNSDVQM